MADHYTRQLPDIDPVETTEWVQSLDAIVSAHGKVRARYIVAKLLERANELQVGVPPTTSTPYVNTIPAEEQPFFPGDEHIERRIRAFIRWNAAAMVIRANKYADGLGGHLSTFASSAAAILSAMPFSRASSAVTIGPHANLRSTTNTMINSTPV